MTSSAIEAGLSAGAVAIGLTVCVTMLAAVAMLWLSLRDATPEQRPAILKALAEVFRSLSQGSGLRLPRRNKEPLDGAGQ